MDLKLGKKYYAKVEKSKSAPIVARGLKNLNDDVIIKPYLSLYENRIFVTIEGIEDGWLVGRFYDIRPFYKQLPLEF